MLLTILLFQAWKRVVSLYLRVPLCCRPICRPCWIYQSPRAQRFFILTKRGRERLVRLMADELGEIAEIATGSETKVSKRKLKRLQVRRSSWFILLVKGMCLFFHPQRITQSLLRIPLLSHNSKQPPFSLRKVFLA